MITKTDYLTSAKSTSDFVQASRQGKLSIADLESKAAELAFVQGITKQKAFARLLKENPQAYKDYLCANPQLDAGQTRDRMAMER